MKARKKFRSLAFILLGCCMLITMIGCGSSKEEWLSELAAGEEGKYNIHIFMRAQDTDEVSYDFTTVINSNEDLLNSLDQYRVFFVDRESNAGYVKWLETEQFPYFVMLDHEDIIYTTHDVEDFNRWEEWINVDEKVN